MKKKLFFLTLCVMFLLSVIGYKLQPSDARYSFNGNLINELKSNMPNYTTIDNIPQNLKNAVIAVEDKRFYSHLGFDPAAMARAIYTDIKAKHFKEGGSTITQQLAKNLFLSNDKSIKRKLEELVFAMKIENSYTKDQILEMYLNVIYYGSDIYGVANASKRYFHKNLKNLTLYECATLAGIPQCPNLYNPIKHPDNAKARQLVVLNAMVKNRFINEASVKLVHKSMLAADK